MESKINMAMYLMNETMPKNATPQQRKDTLADFLALNNEALIKLFNSVKG
jgi:hypothetical protein